MARYYFDLHECGERLRDEDGLDCPDIEAVRHCAIKAARDVMCGEVREGRLCLSCHIEVRDGQERIVLTLPFREAIAVTGC